MKKINLNEVHSGYWYYEIDETNGSLIDSNENDLGVKTLKEHLEDLLKKDDSDEDYSFLKDKRDYIKSILDGSITEVDDENGVIRLDVWSSDGEGTDKGNGVWLTPLSTDDKDVASDLVKYDITIEEYDEVSRLLDLYEEGTDIDDILCTLKKGQQECFCDYARTLNTVWEEEDEEAIDKELEFMNSLFKKKDGTPVEIVRG